MTITSTITSWLGAWKYVLILALLLCASVGWNLHQWESAAVEVEKAKSVQLAADLKTTAGIAKGAQQDNSATFDRLKAIAERGERTTTVYRNVATRHPLAPQCAPGQGRVDAINAGLGPQK